MSFEINDNIFINGAFSFDQNGNRIPTTTTYNSNGGFTQKSGGATLSVHFTNSNNNNNNSPSPPLNSKKITKIQQPATSTIEVNQAAGPIIAPVQNDSTSVFYHMKSISTKTTNGNTTRTFEFRKAQTATEALLARKAQMLPKHNFQIERAVEEVKELATIFNIYKKEVQSHILYGINQKAGSLEFYDENGNLKTFTAVNTVKVIAHPSLPGFPQEKKDRLKRMLEEVCKEGVKVDFEWFDTHPSRIVGHRRLFSSEINNS